MDNFVNFLLDYYIWILAVLGIIIVTIIGFLADSRQKRKKKEQVSVQEEVKTVEAIPESSNMIQNDIQNSTPIVDARTQIPTIDQPEITNSNVETNVLNNVQPADAVMTQNFGPVNHNPVNAKTSTSDVPTLNEQKPHFEPREVNIPTPQVNQVRPQAVVPQPINAVPINQPIQQPIMPQPINQMTLNQANNMPIQHQSFVQPNTLMQQQPVIQSAQNMQPMQKMEQPNVVNNQIPVQNSVVQSTPVNISQPVVNSATTPVNVVTSEQSQNETYSQNNAGATIPNIGISFVTGSDTSNQDNDMWKL